jgi:predicted transcriptional regulator
MDIVASVLDAARGGAKKTHIMYNAFVSGQQVQEYLDLLMKQELIEYVKKENIYCTTEKGMQFLKMYKQVAYGMYPTGTAAMVKRISAYV